MKNNPSVSFAASSLYTREPKKLPTVEEKKSLAVGFVLERCGFQTVEDACPYGLRVDKVEKEADLYT